MVYIVRKFVILIIKFILHIFWVFPVKKNQIFFISYGGKQYSCSPKYVSEFIDSKKYKRVWYLENKNISIDNSIIIRHKFIRYYYYLLTSKFIINNVNISSYIPKRKKQIIINTWHGGGAYKYSGSVVKDVSSLQKFFDINDVFVSSSKIFSDLVIKNTFGFNKVILNVGLPRNDILFSNKSFRDKIFDFLKIDKSDYFIVLYAPTYREIGMKQPFQDFDYKLIIHSFEKRFNKKCIILNRFHHFTKSISSTFDVSMYPDMQELLLSIDALITDYSSSLWDFSLTNKPAFVFAPDLNEYLEDRSFYVNIYEWGFPVSKNNIELSKNILNFDLSNYCNNINKMKNEWGSYETGNACKLISDFIADNE